MEKSYLRVEQIWTSESFVEFPTGQAETSLSSDPGVIVCLGTKHYLKYSIFDLARFRHNGYILFPAYRLLSIEYICCIFH